MFDRAFSCLPSISPFAVHFGRMHLALKAYQELLATVNEMDVCPDEAVRESSRIIKSEAPIRALTPPSRFLPRISFFQVHLSFSKPSCSFLVPTPRQHFLYDGVPRTIPGALSKV